MATGLTVTANGIRKEKDFKIYKYIQSSLFTELLSARKAAKERSAYFSGSHPVRCSSCLTPETEVVWL